MPAALNFWRSLDVLNPGAFTRDIFVIGCGAIGSNFVDTALRSGLGNISAFDFDRVEAHNLPNQCFDLVHIGKFKVEAMVEVAARIGAEIKIGTHPVAGLDINSPAYVILAVDSMATRKSVWESVKMNPNVRLLEARMAAETGTIFCISPCDLKDIEAYEKEWFPDEEAPESACTNRAVCTTAREMAARMVHSIVGWERGDRPPFRIFTSMRPHMVMRLNHK